MTASTAPLRRGPVIAEALFALFLVWLYGGDLALFVRAQGAPLVLAKSLPSVALSVVGVLVAFAVVAGLVGRVSASAPAPLREPRFRALALVTAVTLVGIDFVVLSSRKSPESAEEQVIAAVQSFADAAAASTNLEAVPTDRRSLTQWASQIPDVPLFHEGVRLEHWGVELREGCTGPAMEAGASPAGTILYCVSVDRRRAWVTAVALALGHRFGAPAVISVEGDFVGHLAVVARDSEPSQPVWEPPPPDATP